MGALIITHYQRILHYVKPRVRPHHDGRADRAARAASSSSSSLEREGYDWLREEAEVA